MFWLRLLVCLALIGAALWLFGPREPADLGPVAGQPPEDLGGWLASRDAGARDGAASVLMQGDGDLAIVYLHGFSASPAEMRPLPENLAARLGAGLFVPRLTGHGVEGAALGQARVADWWRDTADAVAVGQRLGRRVVLVGTSTGATLAAEAARDPVLGPQIDAVVMLSANFRVRNRAAALLRWPFARHWVPLVAGDERCFEPLHDAHAAGWTTCYPTVAALPMAALVAHAADGSYGAATQPLLVIRDPRDAVVDPVAADRALEDWAGPVTLHEVTVGQGDDPSAHVIAGDALSPGMTQAITEKIADWVVETVPPARK